MDFSLSDEQKMMIETVRRFIAEELKPLAELFDDATMRALNARVDVDHESPSSVAADFLRQHPIK